MKRDWPCPYCTGPTIELLFNHIFEQECEKNLSFASLSQDCSWMGVGHLIDEQGSPGETEKGGSQDRTALEMITAEKKNTNLGEGRGILRGKTEP